MNINTTNPVKAFIHKKVQAIQTNIESNVKFYNAIIIFFPQLTNPNYLKYFTGKTKKFKKISEVKSFKNLKKEIRKFKKILIHAFKKTSQPLNWEMLTYDYIKANKASLKIQICSYIFNKKEKKAKKTPTCSTKKFIISETFNKKYLLFKLFFLRPLFKSPKLKKDLYFSKNIIPKIKHIQNPKSPAGINELKKIFHQVLQHTYEKSVPKNVKIFSTTSFEHLRKDFLKLRKDFRKFKKFLKNPIINDILYIQSKKNFPKPTFLDILPFKKTEQIIALLFNHIISKYNCKILLKNPLITAPQKEVFVNQKNYELLNKQLKLLEIFFLSNANKFIGVISKLISLKFCEIKNFYEIDKWFISKKFQLKKIQKLDFSNKEIGFIFNQLTFFENLTVLNFSDNKISVFPEKLLNLRHLKILCLWNNKLTSFPNPEPEKNHLSNLKTLFLSENKIKVIPWKLLLLPKLTEIFCCNNPLNPFNIFFKIKDLTYEKPEVTILKNIMAGKMQKPDFLFKEKIINIQYSPYENSSIKMTIKIKAPKNNLENPKISIM